MIMGGMAIFTKGKKRGNGKVQMKLEPRPVSMPFFNADERNNRCLLVPSTMVVTAIMIMTVTMVKTSAATTMAMIVAVFVKTILTMRAKATIMIMITIKRSVGEGG